MEDLFYISAIRRVSLFAAGLSFEFLLVFPVKLGAAPGLKSFFDIEPGPS